MTTLRVRSLAALLVGALVAAALTAAPAGAAPTARPWMLRHSVLLPSGTANQGGATVATATGPPVVTRGSASRAPELARAGWVHIGDPGSVALRCWTPTRASGPRPPSCSC